MFQFEHRIARFGFFVGTKDQNEQQKGKSPNGNQALLDVNLSLSLVSICSFFAYCCSFWFFYCLVWFFNHDDRFGL